MICHFIKDLVKDNIRKPKSINLKQAAALLATGEQNVTSIMLEFLRSSVPVFEEFLTVLQTSGPTAAVNYALLNCFCSVLIVLYSSSASRFTHYGKPVLLTSIYQNERTYLRVAKGR